ncbi:hypothetical protein THARTR1_08350 [Trichoderma harzianum]|uniref:GPI inositol-deacylase winged helix domain-containing protein n=1 Tax=Trichoderma harzianum TaxID=5544 RepID=A0A2K0TYX1_TRIHA|nr:hypothetical protein THARTR1_08350 [Trichoderma harzianum]
MTVSDIRKQLIIFKSRNTENNGDQKGKILAYAYEQAIERIKAQKEGIRNLAMRALAWVTLAKRQITTLELQHALATQDGMTALSHDDLPDLTDITSACVGLLTIDEESRIIRLVHYTTHEYLQQTQNSWFPTAEESILRSCLTYLLFEVFHSGFCPSDEEFEQRLQSFPLFHYASSHWECHLSRNAETIEQVVHFLESQTNVEASMQARLVKKQHPLHQNYSQESPPDMTGLHASALLGLTEATKLLLERGHNPDAMDSCTYTPLSCASLCGHEGVAELLICAGANLEAKDMREGRTPLMHAAAVGHDAVVKLLIERGGDVNAQDRAGRTPLSVAAFYKHKTAIELLLQSNGTINARDSFGAISLYHSAGLRAIRILFSVSPKENPPVTQNNTPEKSDDVVIDQLIESGADLNAKDDAGRMLLGRTLLSYAAEFGQYNVIPLLIVMGKGDLNEADGETGMTPLHWAVKRGHTSVVELLVNAGAELETKEKKHHMTALASAIHYRRKEIVDFLLQRDANVHVSDRAGRTPLYIAAKWGELAIIQQLVDRGADINARTSHGYTALIQTIEQENLDAFRLLVEKGADIHAKDKRGVMPLHFASATGNIDMVRLLLERGADVHARFCTYLTSLFAAVVGGKIDIVRLLAQAGADVDARCVNGMTPLIFAAELRHFEIIKTLIDMGADVNVRHTNGRSALFFAIAARDMSTIELMVGMDNIDIITPDAQGTTPIMLARGLERHRIVKLLLQSGKITHYGG